MRINVPLLFRTALPALKKFSKKELTASKLRKAKARRAELDLRRHGKKSDPILGQVTKFIASLDKPWQKNATEQSTATSTQFSHDGIENVLNAAQVVSTQRVLNTSSEDSKNQNPAELERSLEFFRRTNEQKAEATRRIVAGENASSREICKANIQKAVEKFRRFEADTGSPEVQAAVITVRIHSLFEHVKENHKDHNNYKVLRQLVYDRQRILRYLKRDQPDIYWNTIAELGLKDDVISKPINL